MSDRLRNSVAITFWGVFLAGVIFTVCSINERDFVGFLISAGLTLLAFIVLTVLALGDATPVWHFVAFIITMGTCATVFGALGIAYSVSAEDRSGLGVMLFMMMSGLLCLVVFFSYVTFSKVQPLNNTTTN